MKLLCFLFALVISNGTMACADELSWEKLLQLPGAVVTSSKDANGEDEERIALPSGVTFTRTHQNGSEHVTSDDEHGPVLCAWSIYVELAAEVRACRPGTEIEAELRRGIDRIDDFIVANSLSHITKEELRERASMHEAEFLRQMPKAELARRCPPSDMAQLDRLDPAQLDKFRRRIEELLAIPRPPVMGTCL